MVKKVNIIGAGLAGLSAGIYLQEKGFSTEIFELAGWAGGVCTTWIREGYRFDGCIHWMVGTKPGEAYYQLYRDVDALKEDTEIFNTDAIQMEIQGTIYTIPLRIDAFENFLHSVSPEDSGEIDRFCRDIRTMIETKMPAGSPNNLAGLFKIFRESRGFLSLARKYLDLTVEEFLKSFQSPVIKDIISRLMPPEYTTMGLVMMLGERMGDNAGYPLGGAWDMIRRMEDKYDKLGGKINFNAKVDEILVENGKAVAIRCKDVLFPGEAVVAACDAYDTLHRLLGGHYQHPQLDDMLKNALLFPSLVIISFGLDRKLDIPYAISYEIPQGIETAPGVREYALELHCFDFDPAAAPDNGSSVMTMMPAPLDYWQELRNNDKEAYSRRKKQLCDDAIDLIKTRIPGFKEAVKVTDVATPATYVRLANLYQGSFEGFAPTPQAIKTKVKKTVPGIEGLYLAGQWTTPGGGICTAIQSGKETADAIARAL